ncbi:carbohydrate ABC transporter permease [Alkalibacterium pelagium]|uniref:ABC-type glycerol-3-phosphate transport system, permease component n=1 Tax=Alkalibacterium pelagium TaxID=426702 RepID=A0A1H7JZJ2_9LACT|nr:carbohydrate ABC transporter permease [Alkalibacterium pelagium]GEN50491.1 L-arabinose transport system permease protein AraQ [Alkalibacterium pelagium]SEK80013.1 ABC-type glycerol-3-phosphate transport system, permease component [Alkalibacterium pelagium]
MMNANESKIKKQRILIYIFFGFLTLLSILPFWIVIVNATRTAEQIQQGLSLIPGTNFMENWRILRDGGFNIFQGYGNSFFIAFSSTALSMYFSCLTAYGLTVYDFKLKRPAYLLIMFMIMLPPQVNIIGFYRFMVNLGLLNSYIPLIVPAAASAPTVFFMKQYLQTIYHPALVDSARIDGASELKIFHSIVLPLMRPAIATMSIFGFVQSWNNFLMPLMLINDRSRFTLPMLVQLLTTDTYTTQYGSLYLGISMSIIPLILIYLFLSKHIIGGVTAGGVKM